MVQQRRPLPRGVPELQLASLPALQPGLPSRPSSIQAVRGAPPGGATRQESKARDTEAEPESIDAVARVVAAKRPGKKLKNDKPHAFEILPHPESRSRPDRVGRSQLCRSPPEAPTLPCKTLDLSASFRHGSLKRTGRAPPYTRPFGELPTRY